MFSDRSYMHRVYRTRGRYTYESSLLFLLFSLSRRVYPSVALLVAATREIDNRSLANRAPASLPITSDYSSPGLLLLPAAGFQKHIRLCCCSSGSLLQHSENSVCSISLAKIFCVFGVINLAAWKNQGILTVFALVHRWYIQESEGSELSINIHTVSLIYVYIRRPDRSCALYCARSSSTD